MKKLLQISVIVLLVLAVAATVLTVIGTSSSVAGKLVCTNVGWNSRGTSCYTSAPLPGAPVLAYRFVPPYMPNVGWNT